MDSIWTVETTGRDAVQTIVADRLGPPVTSGSTRAGRGRLARFARQHQLPAALSESFGGWSQCHSPDEKAPRSVMIPDFRDDGYLPEGLHTATEAEVTFRFGTSTSRRRRLILRLRRWLELSRLTHVRRFLVDGSFVTAKGDSNDIDAVAFLADDFEHQVSKGLDAALELEEMLLTRHPEEIFAAEDLHDWNDWVEFFSRTRESDDRRKGIVEIEL